MHTLRSVHPPAVPWRLAIGGGDPFGADLRSGRRRRDHSHHRSHQLPHPDRHVLRGNHPAAHRRGPDLTSARIPTGEHGHARAGAVDKDLAREEPGDGEARLHQQTEYALVYCFCSLNVQAVLTTAESDLKVLDDNLEFLSEAASNLFQARRPPSLHNIT
eukprot:4062111-Pyramimonas_sp.AAC.1